MNALDCTFQRDMLLKRDFDSEESLAEDTLKSHRSMICLYDPTPGQNGLSLVPSAEILDQVWPPMRFKDQRAVANRNEDKANLGSNTRRK
jgi:hypothetical protein